MPAGWPATRSNTLAQGEATLMAGTGSQTDTVNRWGDYSDMTVDPVDDCTFWYTNEYYSTTSSFNWRTRIGNFAFTQCTGGPAAATAAPPPPPPPPPPHYTITTQTGQPIIPGTTDTGNHTDDGVTNIALPFTVYVYGHPYTAANVDSNGTLQFTTAVSTSPNTCLPDASKGVTFFPYWDDQRTDTTGSGIFTADTGTAPAPPVRHRVARPPTSPAGPPTTRSSSTRTTR